MDHSQSSVFHLQGDLIRPEVLKNRADLLGTTSPTPSSWTAFESRRTV
ncbi:hypothetical protein ACHGLA_35170 [Streptomyces sp. YH02]